MRNFKSFDLKSKIVNKKAVVGVIGLGYVGLPLAVEFAKAGFHVVGIDTDSNKIARLNRGESYIGDISSEEVKLIKEKGSFSATNEYSVIKSLDAIIICVPTPLRKTREPDVSYILAAAEQIAKYFSKGKLVVLESTTYPGTTEEIILPRLSKKGFKAGRDFYLAFSPERIDPANKEFKTSNITKVVGGVTKNCTSMARFLYSQIIEKVVSVSSPKTAEMVKLLENTFRIVNIGLVNEIALMCDKLKINAWEVIDGAKTKPFGFMPFYPGPGLGGHCIPIDPIYLSWKARLHGFEARFIELASQINEYMPHYVVDKVIAALNERGKPLKGSKVFILGVAYKKDVSDSRESPAVEIISSLKKRGAIVSYQDPHVTSFNVNGSIYKSSNRPLKDADCVVIVTDHSAFDYKAIVAQAKLVVDTRNALGRLGLNGKKIVRL